MTGKSDPEAILQHMLDFYPQSKVILTLGEKGAIYVDHTMKIHASPPKIKAVDTTAAGDTFIGFFIGALVKQKEVEIALKEACCAAALCATRQGAADAIPDYEEILPLLI